jgi:hypothetical protein
MDFTLVVVPIRVLDVDAAKRHDSRHVCFRLHHDIGTSPGSVCD